MKIFVIIFILYNSNPRLKWFLSKLFALDQRNDGDKPGTLLITLLISFAYWFLSFINLGIKIITTRSSCQDHQNKIIKSWSA